MTSVPKEVGQSSPEAQRPELARLLDLAPHPEGGWFRETWRAPLTLAPEGYEGSRVTATGIYYLLGPGEESLWHQVRSDELWLHHQGVALVLVTGGDGDEPGEERPLVLGADVAHGQAPQALVPAGQWQRAYPQTSGSVLVSCVVSPGFTYADFRTRPPH